MSIPGRTYLSAAARSKNSVDEIRMDYADAKSVLTNHSEDLKRLLSWSVSNDEIVFRARPEAFGIARIGDRVIEVTPKFLFPDETAPDSFVSDLFNVTGTPSNSYLPLAKSELEGAPSSIFDWYFYSVLTQIHEFLRKYDRMVMHSYDEEVIGVRGRLKVAESIRAGKGLKHKNICEIQTTQPRLEFLGTIKGFITLIATFSENTSIQSIAQKSKSILSEINELPFDRSSIRTLKSQAKLLVSEHRKSASILHSVFGFAEMIQMGVGSISHHCFSFNMNAHFEKLVCLLLEKCVVPGESILKSGNLRALHLLNNKCVGLNVEDDEGEFETDSIAIKPDAYIVNSKGVVLSTLDAKYKILNHDSSKNSFSGVQSKDIQQVLAYWLHFRNEQKESLSVGIIYPSPITNDSKEILSKVGFIEMENPLDEKKLKVEIFCVDVLKAVRLLSSGESIDKNQFSNMFAA